MTEILITGGAGFIGFHLAKALAEENYEVTICDNLFRGRMDDDLTRLRKRENVRFINCDLTDKDELKKLGREYDYVYHLAAINGTKYFYEIPHEVLRVGVLSTVNLLEQFKGTKAKMLFASSSEAYAGTALSFGVPIPTPEDVPLTVNDVHNPRFSYGGSKLVGELLFINYARAYKFPMTIIRYYNTYGPRMGYEHVISEFCVRILRKEDPFRIYGGNQTRSFCYISDTVKATRLLMESSETNGEIVNVGNPFEEITIRELAEKMFDLLDFYPAVEVLPLPKGDVVRRCPNIDKLARLTNFRPEVALTDGLVKTFEWYKKAEVG